MHVSSKQNKGRNMLVLTRLALVIVTLRAEKAICHGANSCCLCDRARGTRNRSPRRAQAYRAGNVRFRRAIDVAALKHEVDLRPAMWRRSVGTLPEVATRNRDEGTGRRRRVWKKCARQDWAIIRE